MDYKKHIGFSNGADTSSLFGLNGKPLTAALFIERASQWADVKADRKAAGKETHDPIYTLGEKPKEGLISAYKVYMTSVDEYDAALKLVGSIFHWQELCTKTWFLEHVIQWRDHMALRDFSLAKRNIMKEVTTGDGPASRLLLATASKVINPPPPKKKTQKATKQAEKDSDKNDAISKLHKTYITNGTPATTD